ncbi:S-adenosyl-L-methionine-dependent methyltransferase, partial [Lojkania enalia]
MATEQIDVVYPMEKEKEINRLANQHDVIKDAMRGLLFAKLDLSGTPLRILDSGTADGTWIRDLAASCPDVQHQYVGTDIDPSNFPANPPSRTTYQRQNINEEWPQEWKGSFDLVHQRLALAGGGSAQKPAVLRLVDLVKPGGWIQLIEATNVLPEGNGEVMRGFVGLMNDVFTIMGANLKLMEDLPGWLEEAGLVDVQSKLVELNLGPLNPNPRLATQG